MSTFDRVGLFVLGATCIAAGVLLLVWTLHQWLLATKALDPEPDPDRSTK